MSLFIPLFFSFLPLVICLAYCVISRKCPLFPVLCAVLFAVFAIALASLAQTLLAPVTSFFSGMPQLLFMSFIEAALIEELVKVFCVSLIPGVRKRTLSPDQVLLVSLSLALSFSAFETLSYSIRSPSALWLRALTALPVHAGATIAGGAWIASLVRGYADGEGKGSGKDYSDSFARFFACAVFLHGLFNACMTLSGYFIVPAIGCVVSLLAIAFHVWKKIAERRREDFYR
jgi:RsiW-degrading membrane proteinase PrsW (M82 family)